MTDISRQNRMREGREAQALRYAEEAVHANHYYNKHISYEGVWQIIQCVFCPERIMWHPVTLPPEPTTV